MPRRFAQDRPQRRSEGHPNHGEDESGAGKDVGDGASEVDSFEATLANVVVQRVDEIDERMGEKEEEDN